VVRGVVKAYGDTAALRGVDLAVPAGTVAAVLGPSGCGKTTLLRVVAGFERPDAGSVWVGDRLVVGDGVYLPPERRGVGIVPQDVALFPHLSVAGNVAYGLPRGQRRRDSPRVAELLDLVGLGGLGRRRPHQLSGGQQQRVAVARALAAPGRLVLLDEPFGSLDAALRTSVRAEVLGALRAAGATTVLVTHDQQEALSVADQVAVFRDGRVAQTGSPDELYRNPVDRYVATFIGDSVSLPGAVRAGAAECLLGTLPVHPGVGVGIGAGVGTGEVAAALVLRPEQIGLTDIGEGAKGTKAAVVSQTFLGYDAMVVVELADGTRLTSRRRSDTDHVMPGDHVTVTVTGDVLAFPQPVP
jgi:iron(III) transport system ATP-binding protein